MLFFLLCLRRSFVVRFVVSTFLLFGCSHVFFTSVRFMIHHVHIHVSLTTPSVNALQVSLWCSFPVPNVSGGGMICIVTPASLALPGIHRSTCVLRKRGLYCPLGFFGTVRYPLKYSCPRGRVFSCHLGFVGTIRYRPRYSSRRGACVGLSARLRWHR